MKNFLDKVMAAEVTISQWLSSFIAILFVRFILEFLSSPSSTGVIASDPYTLIHYILFFLATALGTGLVVGYINKDFKGTMNVMLLGFPVIWVAPIIDIVLSRGLGYRMTYIFDTHTTLLRDFLTFFGPTLDHGATYGIRIEIVLILAGIGYYTWVKNKNITKTVLAVIFSYVLGFTLASLPGVLYTITHLHQGTSSGVLNYFQNLVTSSTISHNTLHEGIISVTESRFFELGFDKLMSQILFIFSVTFSGLIFWKINSKKFSCVIKNIRSERINFYIASLLCGMGFAYLNQLGNKFIWVDLLGIICLIISWIGLWMQAVHINDVADVEIDKISNKNRPLVKKDLDYEEMYQIGNMWLIIALLGSWCAGFYPFFMSLVYVSASYIYSAPPLRLRKYPGVPSFLIGVACLATVLSGFFFVSANKEIQNFPILLAVGIIIIVTLAINFKDLKDKEGDKAEGIMTIATLFPKNGTKIIGILLALSILLTPIFLSFYLLYIFAVPTAIVGYILVTRTPYREKPIFILRFVFLACIALSYLGIYWIVKHVL